MPDGARDGRPVTPLEAAAVAAEQEAASLLAEARRAMTLEDTSDLLYDVATDAIEAYQRARARAEELRKLADHATGTYNAFEAEAKPVTGRPDPSLNFEAARNVAALIIAWREGDSAPVDLIFATGDLRGMLIWAVALTAGLMDRLGVDMVAFCRDVIASTVADEAAGR